MNQEHQTDGPSFERLYIVEYFNILDNFFRLFTGKSPQKFSSFKDITKNIRIFFIELMDNIKTNNQRLKAVDMLEEQLKDFYDRHLQKALAFAQNDHSHKLLIGGSNSFGFLQYNAVKAAALMAPTILIPDPVLPWIAEEKKNEKFRFANILKEAFSILQLRPLVESEWENPPVWIFPYHEEIPDENYPENPVTRARYEVLVGDFFHNFISNSVSTYAEALDYAKQNADEFLKKVDENRLFIPWNCKPAITLEQALTSHRENLRSSKNKQGAAKILALPKAELVFEGITERLRHQTLLIENLDQFNAAPLLPVDSHAHYASLCSEANLAKVIDAGLIDANSMALLDMVRACKFNVITEYSIESLIEIKKATAFQNLQTGITSTAMQLFEGQFHEINSKTPDLLTELCTHLAKFQNEITPINEKLKVNYSKQNGPAPESVQLSFFYSPAPFVLNRLPFGPSRRFFSLKGKELKEKAIPTRSLLVITAPKAG